MILVEERLNNILRKIVKKDSDYIKEILWMLCYKPEFVLDTLKLSDSKINVCDLKKMILSEYKKAHNDFEFANENTCYNTYGVDLKIEDPVLRDVVIEHCLELAEDQVLLRSCIFNICSKVSSLYHEEEILEAFNLLYFDMKEKKYIEENVDLYKIGELLKSIQSQYYSNYTPKNKKESNDNFESSNTKTKLNYKYLIYNEEIVKNFFYFIDKFDRKEDAIEFLEKYGNIIHSLKEVNLEPEILLQNEENIKYLYNSIERLYDST